MNSVEKFTQEALTPSPSGTKGSVLYAAYASWIKAKGEPPVTFVVFIREIWRLNLLPLSLVSRPFKYPLVVLDMELLVASMVQPPEPSPLAQPPRPKHITQRKLPIRLDVLLAEYLRQYCRRTTRITHSMELEDLGVRFLGWLEGRGYAVEKTTRWVRTANALSHLGYRCYKVGPKTYTGFVMQTRSK